MFILTDQLVSVVIEIGFSYNQWSKLKRYCIGGYLCTFVGEGVEIISTNKIHLEALVPLPVAANIKYLN